MKKIAVLLMCFVLLCAGASTQDIDYGDYKNIRADAAKGDPNAQYNMGVLYERGQIVKQDYKEAIKWYRKAADQDLAMAQFNLALMYDEGHGVKQDYKEAAKWYKKAAVQGLPQAEYNLGYMYLNGQGVFKDYDEAVKWLKLSAEHGHETAAALLKELGE